MLKFKYSSPGKVILFGEHAVVYGFPAVATAISKRIHMNCELNKSSITEINVVDNFGRFTFNPHDFSTDEKRDPENNRKRMLRAAFQNFPKNHTLNINISSEFPTGNGLGSSASYCSLIATAAARSNGIKLTKDQLYAQAKVLENFFHLNNSGLDPATVIYGKAIMMEERRIKPIHLDSIPLLIIDTFVPRSTAKAVKHVAELSSENPKIFMPMLKILGELSKEFVNSNEKFKFLKKYFPIAQNLLSSLDLSCKQIDEIVKIAKDNGLVAKISGAGMGGTVIVSGDNVHDKAHLFSKYKIIQSSIGEEGIREE